MKTTHSRFRRAGFCLLALVGWLASQVMIPAVGVSAPSEGDLFAKGWGECPWPSGQKYFPPGCADIPGNDPDHDKIPSYNCVDIGGNLKIDTAYNCDPCGNGTYEPQLLEECDKTAPSEAGNDPENCDDQCHLIVLEDDPPPPPPSTSKRPRPRPVVVDRPSRPVVPVTAPAAIAEGACECLPQNPDEAIDGKVVGIAEGGGLTPFTCTYAPSGPVSSALAGKSLTVTQVSGDDVVMKDKTIAAVDGPDPISFTVHAAPIKSLFGEVDQAFELDVGLKDLATGATVETMTCRQAALTISQGGGCSLIRK